MAMTKWEAKTLSIIRNKLDFFAYGNHPRYRTVWRGKKYPKEVMNAFAAVRGRLRRLECELKGR